MHAENEVRVRRRTVVVVRFECGVGAQPSTIDMARQADTVRESERARDMRIGYASTAWQNRQISSRNEQLRLRQIRILFIIIIIIILGKSSLAALA